MAVATHRFGILVSGLILLSLIQPFAVFSPNRIIAGQQIVLFDAMPIGWLIAVLACLSGLIWACLTQRTAGQRCMVAGGSLLIVILAVGQSGTMLLSSSSAYARVSPGAGFWVLLFVLSMALADGIVRLRPSPKARLSILGGALATILMILASGHLNSLSIMSEYANRTETFWLEGLHHIQLALGSLFLASVIGIPLGIWAHRIPAVRAILLNVLSLLQTIPSMALFGLLIAPLGWLASHIGLLHDLGIRGIGMAPAFVALFLYSLLPMVANTTAGLASVGAEISEAATGMGMTPRQRLIQVEFPLALPVILTGVRIVLVQNIGLATIAALIGGGGFGVFVFQGLGQTATDLILLGALPTVALAFAASVILNVMIDLSKKASP